MRTYTIRADLLPHTEQVIFKKATLFGGVENFIVNVKDLQRITFDQMPFKLVTNNLWWDENMIFKDNSTGEIFMFEKRGLWSEEGISHKLIN